MTKANRDPASSRHEWLRSIAASHFSTNRAFLALALPTSVEEAWVRITTLAGITSDEFAAIVATASGLALVQESAPDPSVAHLLPEAVARRNGIAPWAIEADGRLVVAAAEPLEQQALQEIRFAAGGRAVEARVTTPQNIEDARIKVYKGADQTSSAQARKIFDLDNDGTDSSPTGDAELVRFCRSLVRQAIQRRASDIHIHPVADTGVVRFRIDGKLIRAAAISLTVMAATIRLIKARGNMDSTNTLIPQDGRLSIVFQQHRYDLRISTLPASGAEALVLRILDQSRTFDLEKTNFAPWALDALRRLSFNASGLVLLTGPTGSGKTSTLYSLLASLNKTTRRIITVEEPVEYQLQGLTQVEVNNAKGVTFQRALRSILRQDPDILLIGEIRDSETAQIAVQAAMTGHLVFSTLHTPDSVRAIPRLVDLGVPPELLADTLLGVVSQRLMRQLCHHCKAPVVEPIQPLEQLFEHVTNSLPGARAVGCEHCDYTGYYGRFPVVEALEVPDAMRSKLLQGMSDTASLTATIPSSWRSLEANAANWVISGLTTPAEAYDCIGLKFWSALARKKGVDAPIGAYLGLEAAPRVMVATVLIISTHPPVYEDLRLRLSNLGEVALVVGSPEEAVEALHAQHQLHLLIVDITDRGPERRRYMQQLRNSVAWSGLRTVVVYDRTEADIVEKIENFGMHSHVGLPVEGDSFDMKVRKLLSQG